MRRRAHRYEQLVTEGQASFEAGDDEAGRRAGSATRLGMWEGTALVDVSTGPILEIEVMRLEESRLVTVERRIDADLRLGRHSRSSPSSPT